MPMFSQAFQHRVQLTSCKLLPEADMALAALAAWGTEPASAVGVDAVVVVAEEVLVMSSWRALRAAMLTSEVLLRAIFSTYSRRRTHALE